MRHLAILLLVACSGTPAKSTTSSPSPSDAGVATSTIDAALPPGCMRVRQTFVHPCRGTAPRPGEPNSYPATACDECLGNADCTAKPGGECRMTGDGMCNGPAHQVCKYPDPACGNQICVERPIPPPPSARPR